MAVHRGGPLNPEDHRALTLWATGCAEHVVPLVTEHTLGVQLQDILGVARCWVRGEASVGEARAASVMALALARATTDAASVAVIRAAGHSAAAAHMSDHALRAASYALKAVRAAGQKTEHERHWQDAQLPSGIRELVLSARQNRNDTDSD